MTSHPGLIGAEPKDGDFVAYLLEIERRQLAAMDAARLTDGPSSVPPLRGLPTQAARTGRRASAHVQDRTALSESNAGARSTSAQDFIGGLVVALIALVFFLAGLSEAQFVPMLIGAGLAWFAVSRLRRALRGPGHGTGDLAERLERGGFRS